eukprot:1046871-Amphidinium_carterae.1
MSIWLARERGESPCFSPVRPRIGGETTERTKTVQVIRIADSIALDCSVSPEWVMAHRSHAKLRAAT